LELTECKLIDHSDYKISTNWWGLERKYEELDVCVKCGRSSFEGWFKAIDWKSKDRAYWKRIFKEASEEKAFFFKALPMGSGGYVHVDPDINDPALVLRVERPRWLKQRDVITEIKQARYRKRLTETKEHHYGIYQGGINRAVRKMTKNLEYVDNIRFAAVDNRKDMRRYRDARERGCCGYHDEEISVLGKKFMIGCNYGH
jgi:hypothetical protein